MSNYIDKSEFLIEIDPPIVAYKEVVGKRIKLRIGDYTVSMSFPSLPPEDEYDWPTPRKWPTFPGRPNSHAADLTKNVTVESGRYRPASEQQFLIAALRFRINDYPSSQKSSGHIYRDIAQIVSIARKWIAVWTRSPQVELLQLLHPYGVGADYIDGQWSAYLLPGRNRLHSQGSLVPGIDVCRTAFRAGSLGIDVPLEHQLLVNSQFALVMAQYRNAVIDACCAVELALSGRIRETMEAQSERVNSAKKSLSGVMGVVELFRIYDAMFQSDVKMVDVRDKIAAARNKAVHEGVIPSHGVTKLVLTVALRLVFESSPLPFPSGLRRMCFAREQVVTND